MWISSVTAIIAALCSSFEASENTSTSSRGLVCPSTRFGCKNAYRCIEKELMCNAYDDCGDNSDEDLLTCISEGRVPAELTCATDEFKCKNGFKCVSAEYICDNDNDCLDLSDEDPNECIRARIFDDHVTCADIGFTCGGGTGPCISSRFLCNGKNDCGDNTDEDVSICRAEGAVADELSCSDIEFKCKNEFKCVWKFYLCDNRNDCFDGSDEDPVECAKEGLLPVGTVCADLGFECRNTTFNGSFCIGNLFVCNGKDDCGDNSDENPEICEQRSNKPMLYALPWYEPAELNSTDVRICGNDKFFCGSKWGCTSKKFRCHPDSECDVYGPDDLFCLNRTGSYICMSHQIKCNNSKCVAKEYLCDGDDDCGDMSDEDPFMCNSKVLIARETTTTESIRPSTRKWPLVCPRYSFKCFDGSRCLHNTSVCDGQRHCADGSDEAPEFCKTISIPVTSTPGNIHATACLFGRFECNNGRCVHFSFVCDGDNDCKDNTDESPSLCNRKSQIPVGSMNTTDVVSCAANEFLCTDQITCIGIANVCDKSEDCDDGSDENPSICRNSSSQRPAGSKMDFKTVVVVYSMRLTFSHLLA